MNLSCTFHHDRKNDKFEIQYSGLVNIEEIHISGSAVVDLVGTREIDVKLQSDIGNALAEHLVNLGVNSPKDSPAFILLEPDMGIVKNAVPVTPELKSICEKYINESAT